MKIVIALLAITSGVLATSSSMSDYCSSMYNSKDACIEDCLCGWYIPSNNTIGQCIDENADHGNGEFTYSSHCTVDVNIQWSSPQVLIPIIILSQLCCCGICCVIVFNNRCKREFEEIPHPHYHHPPYYGGHV